MIVTASKPVEEQDGDSRNLKLYAQKKITQKNQMKWMCSLEVYVWKSYLKANTFAREKQAVFKRNDGRMIVTCDLNNISLFRSIFQSKKKEEKKEKKKKKKGR